MKFNGVFRLFILTFFFLSSTLSVLLNAQCDTLRYRAPIFESITKHENIKYGEAPVWTIPYNNTNLRMDIFTPDNDDLAYRPLMIWVHPGGFLTGDKSADDMVALCDSFARRGYVTATIGYRLGFNPTSQASGERAVYRGTQDVRAAIRFLKEYREEYGIDTNYTFLGGSSAGGFATLHAAYLDQDEAPSSVYGGVASPDLGCLDCSGNNYQHEMNLSGIVNLWGAIGDSAWINSDETVPALLIHGTNDGVVPYGVGHPFGVFTTPLTHGSRSISNQLTSLSIPHKLITFEGQGHEPHGTDNGTFNSPPTPYWDTIFNAIENHYFDILKPKPLVSFPEVVCQGDTAVVTIDNMSISNICWENLDADFYSLEGNILKLVWEGFGMKSPSFKLYNEANASSDLIELFVDVLEKPNSNFSFSQNGSSFQFSPIQSGNMNYIWSFGDGNGSSNFSPIHNYENEGMYQVTLQVNSTNQCSSISDTIIDARWLSVQSFDENTLAIYPNPVKDILFLESSQVISSINIIDVSGRLVFSEQVGLISSKLNLTEVSKGIYQVVVFFENSDYFISRKIVLE